MELYWAIGLIILQFTVLAYVVHNINYINKAHETLKAELGMRIFIRTEQNVSYAVSDIVRALMEYHKIRIDGVSGIKIVKE